MTALGENRWLCLLLIFALLFATSAGCYTVDPDYRSFYMSGKYQDWMESGGAAGGTVLNPLWLLGLPILALDLVLWPILMIYDLFLYWFGSKARKAPWEWDPFRPKWGSGPSRTFDDDDGDGVDDAEDADDHR